MESFSNLHKRIISASILIPVILAITYIGGFIYNLTITIIAVMLTLEIILLFNNSKQLKLSNKLLAYITLYVALPTASLISLRSLDAGIDIIIYLFALVWLTDIFAYFGGKNFGGPKLAESISPNKTISGAICAICAILIFSIITYFFTKEVNFFLFLFISILLSIISQIGDLFQSWVKRKLDVKDSGKLIPGHGGICDRIDGLLFVLPVAYIIFMLVKNNIF